MDGEEEKIVYFTAALAVVIMVVIYFHLLYRQRRTPIPREPSNVRDLYWHAYMHHILNGSNSSCVDYLRMRKGTFIHLEQVLRDSGLLGDLFMCR